ncbi:hypothetical protein FRX31_028391 [Thalictrum thalictroides]|uniref:Reverse transcriptase zinc-binding domain-containing protein n=1 Tax=Thalictrum thalictroides TaxID=46969 RepID=A0A7J6VBI7_THATH|nr:hypothetical protein FRX31_028391 [Thalictrum thalictroides]
MEWNEVNLRNPHNNFAAKLVWNSEMPSKVQFFLVFHGRTLTKDVLIRKGTAFSPICCLCGSVGESISHLFLHCSKALRVWKSLTEPFHGTFQNLFAVDSVEQWLQSWRQEIHNNGLTMYGDYYLMQRYGHFGK